MFLGDAPAVPPGEAGLSSSGQRSPHCPQPTTEACEGSAGGGSECPLQLPESWIAWGGALLLPES